MHALWLENIDKQLDFSRAIFFIKNVLSATPTNYAGQLVSINSEDSTV
jgi:hypothetical protein